LVPIITWIFLALMLTGIAANTTDNCSLGTPNRNTLGKKN
jgi:hypothetical protein